MEPTKVIWENNLGEVHESLPQADFWINGMHYVVVIDPRTELPRVLLIAYVQDPKTWCAEILPE